MGFFQSQYNIEIDFDSKKIKKLILFLYTESKKRELNKEIFPSEFSYTQIRKIIENSIKLIFKEKIQLEEIVYLNKFINLITKKENHGFGYHAHITKNGKRINIVITVNPVNGEIRAEKHGDGRYLTVIVGENKEEIKASLEKFFKKGVRKNILKCTKKFFGKFIKCKSQTELQVANSNSILIGTI